MGTFIQIAIDESWANSADALSLVKECPVDIFEWKNETLVTRPEQEDECTLCELCLEFAPAGVLTILKSYKAERLVSRGKRVQS
jgi:NAD-dependent dihydropyrimidine dehydrogenase PreA subunit